MSEGSASELSLGLFLFIYLLFTNETQGKRLKQSKCWLRQERLLCCRTRLIGRQVGATFDILAVASLANGRKREVKTVFFFPHGVQERDNNGQNHQRQVTEANLKLSEATTFEESSRHTGPTRAATITADSRLN